MKIRKSRHQKTYKRCLVVFIIICIGICAYLFYPHSYQSMDKRAVWFSYIDIAKFSYESKDDFEHDFIEAIQTVKTYKTNTIMVQVRAFSDALYDSSLFPLSQVITNQTSLSFDPLEVMIQLAHDYGLTIEAWVNPYRISLNQETYLQFVTYSKYKNWIRDTTKVIQYDDYKYILNPQSQEVRDYIVEGVKEIVSHYDVDGICFDDYFYVEGTHENTTQNQRLDNVNMLIRDVYYSIKQIDQQVTFGISPQGNYENCIQQGVDVDLWLKEEGYIDYLMPQIYWTDHYGENGQTKMFTNRTKQFSKLKKHQSVSLYASLALYQAGLDLEFDQGWSLSNKNISEQITILSRYGYKGYGIFSYSSLLNEDGKKEMDYLIKHNPFL